MADTFNPRTGEAKAGRSPSSRPAWSAKQVQDTQGSSENPCLKKSKQTNYYQFHLQEMLGLNTSAVKAML